MRRHMKVSQNPLLRVIKACCLILILQKGSCQGPDISYHHRQAMVFPNSVSQPLCLQNQPQENLLYIQRSRTKKISHKVLVT